MGVVMRAWYDINALDESARVDRPGLERSVDMIRSLIARELGRGIPMKRILLAGFSQGGSVALRVAITALERPAGVIALSTYLIDAHHPGAEEVSALRIFQAHGTYDAVVPFAWGVQTRDRLRELGCDVTWNAYPMDHAVCPEEIEDLAEWMKECLQHKE
jgi:phospholipase/carboxylesterase